MKSVFKAGLLVSILLFIISLPVTDLSAQRFSPWEIEKIIGKEAPDFRVKDFSGNTVSLSSFKGKPILLNFWATWCPYCREERPHLNSLYKEYKDRGLVIIAVSIDRSAAKVRKYLKRIPVEYTVLIDEGAEAAKAYGVFALPTSFLIDRDGKIKHKFMGMRKWTSRSSKGHIEELLER